MTRLLTYCVSHCVSACADVVAWLLLLSVDGVSLEREETHCLLSVVGASSVGSDVPPAPPASFLLVTPGFLLSFHAAALVLPASSHVVFLGPPLSSPVAFLGPPLSSPVAFLGPPLFSHAVVADAQLPLGL